MRQHDLLKNPALSGEDSQVKLRMFVSILRTDSGPDRPSPDRFLSPAELESDSESELELESESATESESESEKETQSESKLESKSESELK